MSRPLASSTVVTIDSFIAPVDGSALGDLGAKVAVALAERIGVRSSLLSAAGALDVEHGARHAADLARSLGPNVSWSIDGTVDPVRAIVNEFWRTENSVICMATHGRGRSSAILGSVANDVIAELHQPMVLVGPEVEPHSVTIGDRVVACVDGSEAAEATIAPALAWGRLLGVPVEIVTVIEPVLSSVAGAIVHRMHGPSDPEGYLRDLVTRVDGADGVRTKVVADPVSVSAGLQAYLRDNPAVLTVVARHVRSAGARVALGDTAATIVRRSPVPVLTVPV